MGQMVCPAATTTTTTTTTTVLEESDDLVILGVTFDSKMTFEKHFRSVSKAAPQDLVS